MYKNRFLFFVKIFLFLILNNFSITNCVTLDGWAGNCFTHQPEFARKMPSEFDYKMGEIEYEREEPFLKETKKIVEASNICELLEEAITRYSSRFIDEMSWLNEYTGSDENGVSADGVHKYVQRLIVTPGSKIIIIGDIHGSVHSLLRNLLRLKVLG
jgi:hypothetical protein